MKIIVDKRENPRRPPPPELDHLEPAAIRCSRAGRSRIMVAMDSDDEIEQAWAAMRDAEVASRSRLGRKLVADPKAAAQWHRQVISKLRAMVRASEHRGVAPQLTKEAMRRWDAEATKAKLRRRRERDLARREAARNKADLARMQLVNQAAAVVADEEARARLRSAMPRLKIQAAPPREPSNQTVDACLHGLDRRSCAYCRRHHR